MLPSLAPNADGRVSEEMCASASAMANNLGASAIFVYTRRGYMANFLSRCRPDCPIFAFTGLVVSPLASNCSFNSDFSAVSLPLLRHLWLNSGTHGLILLIHFPPELRLQDNPSAML